MKITVFRSFITCDGRLLIIIATFLSERANMPQTATRRKEYRSTQAFKIRAHTLYRQSVGRWKYGISTHEFDEFLRKQGNACAICAVRFSVDSVPYIDHDHSSGWVRGLLCHNCNAAIGLLKDSAICLQAAVEYLIHAATPTEFNVGAQKEKVRLGSANSSANFKPV